MASFLQGTGIQSTGSVANVTKAFASALTAGSLLSVGGITSNAAMPAGCVTDTLANAYALDVTVQRASNEQVAKFSAVANGAGACTVTLDCTGSDVQSIEISEFAPDPGNSWDTVAANRRDDTGSAVDSVGSLNVTCSNIVPAGSGVVVGVMTQSAGNIPITPVSPWIQIFEDEDATDMPVNGIYRLTTPGTYAPAWTMTSTRTWACVGVAYKENTGASASGGTMQRPVAQGWI